MSSLDNFFRESENVTLNAEERKKFEKWISKILSEPAKISSIIEDALKRGMYTEWEEESRDHKFRLGSYYPSLIERCLRQQAYSYLYPKAPTHEELAIFNEGRAIHELIASALRRSGLVSVEGKEVVVELEFEEAKLHGRIDDLLLIRMSEAGDNFKLFVPLEIKSTSTLPVEPKQSHYYQLSTYLLAKDYPMGVLLYWAKRGGGVKAFTIAKEDAMYSVLRERVFELHAALKQGAMPRKEAVENRYYSQCEWCNYQEQCNPFLIDAIPEGSSLAIFDIDSTLLDTSQKKRTVMQELGLSPSTRFSDVLDEETKDRYWELLDNPKYVELDALIESGRDNVYEQVKLGRVIIGISSSRHDKLLDATKARLANLGIPIPHLLLREPGNYDTDGKFKMKWALRLARNYEIAEIFDRDAVTGSMIMKDVEKYGLKQRTAKEPSSEV